MRLFRRFRKEIPENPGITSGTSNEINKFGNDLSVHSNGSIGLDAVYAFLQFDYESKGYNDALSNPDDSYKSDNIKLIGHDLLILIDRSVNYYETLLKELDFHISSRTRAGLIDLVEELKIRQEIIKDQLEKIKAVKAEAMSGSGATQRIALSYQRGFMKGLSAISQSKMFNRNM